MTHATDAAEYRVDPSGIMPSFGGPCVFCERDWLTYSWLAPVRATANVGAFERRSPVCHACNHALPIQPGLMLQLVQVGAWRELRLAALLTSEEATYEIKDQVRRAIRRGESPIGVQLGPAALAAVAHNQRGQVARIHILAGWIRGLTAPPGFDELAPLGVEQVAEATAVRVIVQAP